MGELVDREPVSRHRVPHADEPDRQRRGVGDAVVAGLGVGFEALTLLAEADHGVPSSAQEGDMGLAAPSESLPAIGAVGGGDLALQIGLVPRVGDDPLVQDQADQDPGREGSPAEAERIDLVARPVRAADEGVEVAHVAGEADPEGPAQHGERLEGRGADAVVVVGKLARMLGSAVGEIDSLVQPPDVRPEHFPGTVAGPVGEHENVPGRGHGCLLHPIISRGGR